jgi:hypothetical protein
MTAGMARYEFAAIAAYATSRPLAQVTDGFSLKRRFAPSPTRK